MSDDHLGARPEAHHPRAEAHARLEGRYTVRVLEPSPPAITSPPFHADDPCSRASDNERLVVSPVAATVDRLQAALRALGPPAERTGTDG